MSLVLSKLLVCWHLPSLLVLSKTTNMVARPNFFEIFEFFFRFCPRLQNFSNNVRFVIIDHKNPTNIFLTKIFLIFGGLVGSSKNFWAGGLPVQRPRNFETDNFLEPYYSHGRAEKAGRLLRYNLSKCPPSSLTDYICISKFFCNRASFSP